VETRLVKAAVVAALGLVLLVPTFNALNASYVKNDPPPPWLRPPTPPDITPPTDLSPPPDFTPPTGYKGKIPPICPPPVVEPLLNVTDDLSNSKTSGSYDKTLPFDVKNETIGFRVYVNWTNWEARTVGAKISGPPGFQAWSNSTTGQTGGVPLVGVTPQQDASYVYDSYTEGGGQVAKAGRYTLDLSAQTPLQGTVSVQGYAALACGGILS
jgi:hypothetical protein